MRPFFGKRSRGCIVDIAIEDAENAKKSENPPFSLLSLEKMRGLRYNNGKSENGARTECNRREHGIVNPDMTAMKRIGKFCEEEQIPFDEIESAWLAEKE